MLRYTVPKNPCAANGLFSIWLFSNISQTVLWSSCRRFCWIFQVLSLGNKNDFNHRNKREEIVEVLRGQLFLGHPPLIWCNCCSTICFILFFLFTDDILSKVKPVLKLFNVRSSFQVQIALSKRKINLNLESNHTIILTDQR